MSRLENAPASIQLPSDLTPKSLTDFLRTNHIPVEKWGTGDAKTVEHFLKEIQDKETILVPGENGELLRRVNVTGVNVIYVDFKGNTYRLHEEKQVFHDGRVRQRTLEASLTEKMVPGETPEEAAYRALEDELQQLTDRFGKGWSQKLRLSEFVVKNVPVESPSYPGVKSEYVLHTTEVKLPFEFYRPIGYQELQKDKTNYFVWERIAKTK